jgi:hypothetical protein
MPSERSIERVAATARSSNGVTYVCPIGWSTQVFHLHGAAGAVWQSLESSRTVAELAADNGVDDDDTFLIASITLMIDAGLAREST